MTIEIGRREDLIAAELFCGGGGMLLGVKDAGFKSIAAVERDDRACETLQLNGVSGVIHADVRDVDFQVLRDQVDLLTGGHLASRSATGAITWGIWMPET